jgi:tetratricopeptide (TPR) repeat protein
VRAAIVYSLDQGDAALAVNMLGAIASEWDWDWSGDLKEQWQSLFQQALACGAGSKWARARARLMAAVLEQSYARVEQLLQINGGEWEYTDDPQLEAERLRLLFDLAGGISDGSRKRSLLDQALRLAATIGDTMTRFYPLVLLGLEQLREGDHATALASYTEALALSREARCVKYTAMTLNRMAEELDVSPAQRINWLDEASQLLAMSGETHQLAVNELYRSTIDRLMGDIAQAQTAYDRATALFGAAPGLVIDISLALQAGLLAEGWGDLEGATEAYMRSLQLTPIRPVNRVRLWLGFAGLGRVTQHVGDAARAAWLFGAATQLSDGYPYPFTYVGRIEQQHYTQAIESSRAALGDEAFAAAFAAGKATPLEQAVAAALAMPIPAIAPSLEQKAS